MDFCIEMNQRESLVDITDKIKEHVPSGSGIVHVFVPHATAGFTINENDES